MEHITCPRWRTPRPAHWARARASPHIRAPSPIAPTEFQKFETLRLFIVLCRFATKDKLFYRQLTLATLRKRGIGGIFNTRKGNFQYKISLYIIIYLDYIIVYHVYHQHVSNISCPSSTHDISLVSSSFLRHVISCDLMSRF